jgi:hypothetical protein
MKRCLLFAFSTLVIASSCQKAGLDNWDDANPTNPNNPNNPNNPASSALYLSRPAIDVGTLSGFTDTFTIQSKSDWAITLSAGAETWLQLDTQKGASGATVVKISVIADNTSATKTGTITVSPVGSSTATAQVLTVKQQLYSMLWQKALTISGYSSLMAVIQDTDGGYVFSGSADVAGEKYSKCWVTKTDVNGNRLWEVSANATGYLNSVAKTPDGGYVAAGHRNNYTPTGGYRGTDLVVVKLNAGGAIVWEKIFGGGGDDFAAKVVNTADGGYMISGITNSSDGDVVNNHGSYDIWLIKVDASGNKVWAKTLGGSGWDGDGLLATTADGNYLLTAYSSSTDGDISGGKGKGDVVVFKLDASGNIIWTKIYGGSDYDSPASIITTNDGGSIIVGSTSSNDGDVVGQHGSDEDMWVLKLDNNGQKTWQATLGSTTWENGYSIAQLTDGGYMALGFSIGDDGDVSGNHGDKDYWVVKLSSAGKKLWQRSFGGPGEELPEAIAASSDGGFVMAGFSKADGGDVTGINGVAKGWVVKCKP